MTGFNDTISYQNRYVLLMWMQFDIIGVEIDVLTWIVTN